MYSHSLSFLERLGTFDLSCRVQQNLFQGVSARGERERMFRPLISSERSEKTPSDLCQWVREQLLDHELERGTPRSVIKKIITMSPLDTRRSSTTGTLPSLEQRLLIP